ncbi:MAG: Ferredoxin [Candidatus Dichloromethanomonas elyunquensis]|nr:MAG: Ferredoxin [Candidatus Dichloromethanomonas elyunquensis]
MKATINKDCCIGCGVCEAACPEVFKPGEDGTYEAVDQQIPESLMESAQEAKSSCPNECITIE